MGIDVPVLAERLPAQWCALSLAADSLSMVVLTVLEILTVVMSSSLLLTVV